MATAGRILIIPRGDYDANATYEMLDLVNHDGKSWLAKKHSQGIAPSAEASDYWFMALGVVHKEKPIANNLITTEEGFVLDARQGKVLMYAIESVNTEVLEIGTSLTEMQNVLSETQTSLSETQTSLTETQDSLAEAETTLTSLSDFVAKMQSDDDKEYWHNLFDITSAIKKVNGDFGIYEKKDLPTEQSTEVNMDKQIENGISIMFIKDIDAVVSNLPPHIFVLTRNGDNYRADSLLTNDRVESVDFINGVPHIKFSSVTYPYVCVYKIM